MSTSVRRFALVLLASTLFVASVAGLAPDTAAVDPARELVITDASVVESPQETTFDPSRPSGTARQGAWSFGRLVHNMLPPAERDSPAAASQLVLNWLRTWESDQSPNPLVSPALARPAIRTLITNRWKAASGCAAPESPASDATCVLDMTQAPFRLIAIVNRPDLRLVTTDGSAIGGEGRFVFQVVGPTLGVRENSGEIDVMEAAIAAQKFTVIFEYSLPVARNADTLVWARRWHDLGSLPFGAEFNSTLRAITNGFAGPDRDLRRPNGNALNQLRTNEVALKGARFPLAGFVAAKQFWELREFHLTSAGLEPHTVNLEPARDFDVTRTGQTGAEGTHTWALVDFLTANGDAVLASRYRFPASMDANSALVGSAPYGAWGKLVNPNPPAIPSQGVAHDLPGVPVGVRDTFAMNTCAGCHRHETDTRHFMHITALGAMEPLSKVDDRTRIGVAPGTPENVVVLSNALAAEIGPGGPRFEDFSTLLKTAPGNLRTLQGIRVCAR
jgi:hypothetical protein